MRRGWKLSSELEDTQASLASTQEELGEIQLDLAASKQVVAEQVETEGRLTSEANLLTHSLDEVGPGCAFAWRG